MKAVFKGAAIAAAVSVLVACGGGGDDGVTSDNPLAKYAGTYSYCDQDHTKYVLAISTSGSESLNVAPSEVTYSNANCTGTVLGTYSWDRTGTVTYLSTGVQPVDSNGALPANPSVDRVEVAVTNVRPSLSGPAVTDNCLIYGGGSICYDLGAINETSQGAFLLQDNTLYEIPLQNGAYTLDGVYIKN